MSAQETTAQLRRTCLLLRSRFPNAELAGRILALIGAYEALELVCAAYADDEDRFNRGAGEPYGSIPTEVGLVARSARRRFRERRGLPV